MNILKKSKNIMNENIIFKKVIGLDHAIINFKMNISSRNNQIWMLIGKRGIGKRTLSMRLSAYIINNFSDGWEYSELTNEIFSFVELCWVNKKTNDSCAVFLD